MDTTDRARDMLDALRPDRYTAGSIEWADPAVEMVASTITISEARRIAAREIVGRIERHATRKPNALLRHVMLTGEFPLDWMDQLRQPIAVGRERVTFGAATPEDLRLFAADEREAAGVSFETRLETCQAAEALADKMDAAKVGRFDDYAALATGERQAS